MYSFPQIIILKRLFSPGCISGIFVKKIRRLQLKRFMFGSSILVHVCRSGSVLLILFCSMNSSVVTAPALFFPLRVSVTSWKSCELPYEFYDCSRIVLFGLWEEGHWNFGDDCIKPEDCFGQDGLLFHSIILLIHERGIVSHPVWLSFGVVIFDFLGFIPSYFSLKLLGLGLFLWFFFSVYLSFICRNTTDFRMLNFYSSIWTWQNNSRRNLRPCRYRGIQ